MAAPNLYNISTITAKVTGSSLTASLADIVANTAGSNTLVKINSIYASNIDGTNNYAVSVALVKDAAATLYLASTVTVPADATLVIVTRDSPVFLEENDKIQALAAVSGKINLIVNYEVIA